MSIWPPEPGSLKRPAYRSLAQSIIEAIEAGELKPGTRLPTHRALSYDLGLSVQTVSRAYEELTRMGIVEGEVGRGSFVRGGPPDARMPWHRLARSEEVIDCSMLVPVTGEIHATRMAATLSELAADLPATSLFSFRPRATLEAHCAHALAWLARCGLETTADQILPTNGNTSAMTVALMTAAMPGDLIVTEEMGHHTLQSLTNTLGLRLGGIAMDREGVLPDAFAQACEASQVKALFLLPSGLNPTTATMSLERREAIAAVAREHDVWIIENDAWGPIQSRRPPPIASLAPERTFYFTGLTKCLLPGLRIAWLVVPDTLSAAARTRHLVTSWMATPLMAEIAARWLADGTALELLNWQRGRLARRNAIAVRILEGIDFCATPNGLHIWLPISQTWREEAFVTHARHGGVAIAAGANFAYRVPQPVQGVRISLGAGSEQDIEQGLKVVARLARSTPEPALLAI